MTALQKVVEHQRKQIELLKQQLIKAGNDRDAQMEWVRRHEEHLGEIRIKLSHIWQFLDLKNIEAFRSLDWLRNESDRNDYDVDKAS